MEEELSYEVCLLNHSTILVLLREVSFFVPIITVEFNMNMASCLLLLVISARMAEGISHSTLPCDCVVVVCK
jgi:hypothetical protein